MRGASWCFTASVAEPQAITVEDDPAGERYVLMVDGQLAGSAYYEADGSRRTFIHTEVDPEFEGHGLGGRLAAAALADVRERGFTAVPLCPFIASWLRRHPDQLDVVEEPYRTQLAARTA
jgi:hypothetical protein